MQSTRKKLDGNLPQFLGDVEKYGRWEAMNRWGIKDYLSVTKIIQEETGNENFGLNQTAHTYASEGIQGLLREFISQFAHYIIRVDAENKLLRRRLEAYTAGAKETELQVADEITGLMEELRC